MQTLGLKYLHLSSFAGVQKSATEREAAFQVLPPSRRTASFAGSVLAHGAVFLFSGLFSEYSVPEADPGPPRHYSLQLLRLKPNPAPFDLTAAMFRSPRQKLDDLQAKNTPEPLPDQSLQDFSRRERLQQWLDAVEKEILEGQLITDSDEPADAPPRPVLYFIPSHENQASSAVLPAARGAGIPRPVALPPVLAPEVTEDFKASLGTIVSMLNHALPARPMAPPPATIPTPRAPSVAALPPQQLAPKAIVSGAPSALNVQLPASVQLPTRRMAPQTITSTPRPSGGGRAVGMPEAPTLGVASLSPQNLASANLAGLTGTLPIAVPGPASQPGMGAPAALPGPKSVRIVKPQNGRFSTVTTSSSSAVAFPGTEGLLQGKVVNTAYVNVGLKKNWILQYVVSSEENVTGAAVPVEAPWPWVIERPEEVSIGGNDYVIVHGFIRASGRLEDLAMQQTEAFPGSEFLMKLLSNWEFRPASRSGTPATVEILLIIPSIAK